MPASNRNSVSFCLFVMFEEEMPGVDEARLQAIPGLQKAHIYTPDRAHDPFLNDGAPPPLVVQAYFASLYELELGCEKLTDLRCAAQAMAVRRFAVPHPILQSEPYCTYLVAYEGPAEDEKAWHAHYLAHHPPLMARLPGVRQLEVYLPVEWRCPALWRRENDMQRNKVAFDSAEALSAALNSPVRKEMRADYARLPPFAGRVTHFPMSTHVVS